MQNRSQTSAEEIFLNPILQGGGNRLPEFSSEFSRTKFFIIAEPKNDADAKLVPEIHFANETCCQEITSSYLIFVCYFI